MLIALGGAKRLIKKLLSTLMGLDAAEELLSFPGSPRETLGNDIYDIYGRFPERANMEALASLLEHVITEPVDEESLWSAVYELFNKVSDRPTTPTRKSYSYAPANHDT